MDITPPGVTVVTLTLPERTRFLNRAMDLIRRQNYRGEIEHIIVTGAGEIGAKRNTGVRAASHDIILMYDDDDLIGRDYIRLAVPFLDKADVTGLSSAHYVDEATGARYLYKYTGSQPYVIGSGMMFKKSAWIRNPFPDNCSMGEDAKFLAKAGKVAPNGLIDQFTATLHPGNTASHLSVRFMDRID